MKLHYFLIILFVIFSQLSFSQVSEEQEDLIEAAKDLFDDGDYKKAMPLYSQLLSIYPSEPVYSFYYGACLVENNKEIDKAIKYLSYGARKLKEEPLVYYYLGSAYHLSYQFDKAIAQYQIYQTQATEKQQKEKQSEREITICTNGLDLVKYSSQLIVLDNKKIKQSNFQYSYDLNQIGGNLVIKPDQFKTKVDLKKNAKELIFISDSGRVFFSSLGDDKNGDRDIYWTEKDAAGEFLPSKNIGATINTPYDEDYPFLKADGKTLYFCSKGHNTMGGYDIFKSEFDTINQIWDSPVNLDFPTNTPYDDLLYVVDADDNLAYFASNRESQEDKLNVYKIQVDKNPLEREIMSLEELQQIAKLDVTPLADRPNPDDNKDVTLATTEVAKYQTNGPKTDFSFDEVYENNVSGSGDYTKILRADLVQLEINLQKAESKNILATNIAHNKVGRIRELQSQIETRQNRLTVEEQLTDQELLSLLDESFKINTQAYISAKTAETFSKEIEIRKREIKITEMLLNDSANNSTQELVQNINANRKFLQQNNKTYLSLQNWTREKEREKVLVVQRVEQKKQESDKKKMTFNQVLADYKQAEKKLKQSKEPLEITQAKKSLNLIKEELAVAKSEVIVAEEDLFNEQAIAQRMDEEIIFLNTINSEVSDTQNQQLANGNKSLDHKLIIENAKELNEDILALQEENISLTINSKYEEETADIFDNQEELLVDNNETTDVLEENTESTNEQESDGGIAKVGESESDIEVAKEADKESTKASDTNPNKAQIVSTDLIQVYSLDARKKYKEAKQSAQLSDSLSSLASEKEKRVNFIPNAEQQDIIKNEIEELNQLSKIKANQSIVAYQEAEKIEQKFIVEHEPDTAIESLIRKKVFAFESDEDDSPELIEYKKAAFKEQYYQRKLEDLQSQKKTTERALDEESISVEVREQFQADLAYQIKTEKKINEIIVDARETQLEMKDVLIANNESYPISKGEIYLSATEKHLTDNVQLTKQQEKTNKTIKKDREEAKELIVSWNAKVDQIKQLEDSILVTEDKSSKVELSDEIADIKVEAWADYKKANELQQFANMEEAGMLESLLNINRKYNQNEESSQAYVFEKESELLTKKAAVLRESATPSETYDPAIADLFERAQIYETIALNRQKSALDIYASIPEDKPKDKELLVENNTDESVEPDNNFEEESAEVNAVMTELLPDEEEKIAEYQKLYSQSESKQIKADSYWEDVEESKKKLERTFSKKDQDKLKAKIEKQELKAKLTYHDAYLKQEKANKEKYNLYSRKTTNALNISSDETHKSIAQQYLLDAEFYYEEAQKTRVDSLYSVNELRAQHSKKLDLEKEALEAQELAFMTLTNQTDTDFLMSGSLVKIDPLEAAEKPIDTDLIQKVQSQRILSHLELDSYEAKQLAKVEKLKDEHKKLSKEYLENKEIVEELKDSLPNITDPKQWEKVDEEISDLDAKSLSYLFNIAQTTEPINYEKYMVYKNHIKEYRIKGREEKAVTGRALEKEANKDFRKAQNLRARSFEVVSVDRAYEMLEQAGDLEKSSLAKMEKAYTIYLDLAPIEEDVEKYLAENTDTNKVGIHGNTLVESEGQVEEFETPEIDLTVVPVISNDTTATMAFSLPEDSVTIVVIDTITTEAVNVDTVFVAELIEEPKDTIVPDVTEEIIVENIDVIEETEVAEEETPVETIEKSDTQIENIVETDNRPSLLSIGKVSVYNKQNPIPVNKPLPQGIVYKIQIGAFTKPIPQNSFRGLKPITGETRQNSKYVRYFVGLFNTYDAANTALPFIKNSGYQDAFVVAYKDGQRVAVYIAKQESQKQDNYQELAQAETQAVLKTVNSNADDLAGNTTTQKANPSVNVTEFKGAMYTVQIGAYKTHVSHSRLKNLAPLYNDVTSTGLIRYYVGKFVDYNEANKRKNEIRRAGIKDAFVTAFKNGQKISVGQARKELANINTTNKTEEVTTKPTTVEEDKIINQVSELNREKLSYRVQIGAFSKTVPVEVVSSFVKLSMLDQLDQFVSSTGKTIYTLGQFKSLSEANLLKQDLIEQGITDAFIIAYDGKIKVTIEEAKKILQP